MKIRKIYLMILGLMVLVSACELPDNIDPKSATEVPVETLLTNAQVSFVDAVDEISMNVNITRFLAQYCSQTAYTQESRYDFEDRQVPDTYWNQLYRSTLIDLKDARTSLEAQAGNESFNATRDNKIAIIDVIEVYIYHTLIDFFGNIPYEEALMGSENLTPVYDDAKTVHLDLISRLTDDIATLSNGNGDSWGAEELFFGGDTEAWAKVAASLKLRMAMRLADTDAAAAQTHAEAAINAGLIASNDEGFIFHWNGTSPHVNTIHERFNLDGRTDYAPSKTIIDKMLDLNDPRVPLYFAQVDTSGSGDLAYWGLPYGLPGSVNANSYSKFAPEMFAADYPAVLIGYDEVEFLLAEAAARGYTTGGTADEHYEDAITASIEYWGGTAGDAATYVASADVAYDANSWKELIGTQKWIALYNRGNEGYASWRIFDWPVLTPPPDFSQEDIPLRWPYPYNEVDLNPDSYATAAAAIGGDDVRTQLFWDATPNSASPSAD